MFVHVTHLVLAAAIGAAPTTAVPFVPASTVVIDSMPVLTVDVLTQMTTFWAALMKESPAIRDTGRTQHQKPLAVLVDYGNGSTKEFKLPSVIDMVGMAAKYPAVAADLKQADLTASQWEQYRNALMSAVITDQLAKDSIAKSSNSAVGKNVAFLTAHTKEFIALRATGMWFPLLLPPALGGTGSDLNS